MRTLVLLLACCCSCLVIAQNKSYFKSLKNEHWVKFDVSKGRNTQEATRLFHADFGLKEDDELVLEKTLTDNRGIKHHRCRQNYKGFPIENAIVYIHEKNGIAQNANGKLVLDLDLNITPILTTQAALAIALQEICLLYTSPSPRDLSTSRMPSSA